MTNPRIEEARLWEISEPLQFAVCIGTDAMRLCMGKKPRNFSRAEVIRWLNIMGRAET